MKLASPTTALIIGGLVLVLMTADAPSAGLAHQSMKAGGSSLSARTTFSET